MFVYKYFKNFRQTFLSFYSLKLTLFGFKIVTLNFFKFIFQKMFQLIRKSIKVVEIIYKILFQKVFNKRQVLLSIMFFIILKAEYD